MLGGERPRRQGAMASLLVLVLGVVALSVPSRAAPPAEGARCVLVSELDGIVNAGTSRYLLRAVRTAQEDACTALVVRVDTPGGTLDATREIVGTFLRSEVPIVAHVAPEGARAGSAGMFIVLSAHVAAMAPGSNIGAAHPVLLGGGGAEADPEMKKKIVNDTAAFARAIAEKRARNLEWAEAAVRESRSATASEARDHRVIDLVAATRGELLRQINGREISVDGRAARLATEGAAIRPLPMTIQERVLAALGNPSLAYLLLMVGLFALTFEIYAPTTFLFAGVGVVCLLLAAVGLNMLPVNAGGVLFIVLGVALFVAEFFLTSHGLLSLGGVAALLVGSALLYDRSDADFFADASTRLSWGLILPLALVLAGGAVLFGVFASRSQRRTHVTGREALVDARGTALTAIDSLQGQVWVHGERWNAVSDVEIAKGEAVRVVASSGLTLRVVRSNHGIQPRSSQEQGT